MIILQNSFSGVEKVNHKKAASRRIFLRKAAYEKMI